MKNFKSSTVSITKPPTDADGGIANSGSAFASPIVAAAGSDHLYPLATSFTSVEFPKIEGVVELKSTATRKSSSHKFHSKKARQEESLREPKGPRANEIFEIAPREVLFEFDKLNQEYESSVCFTNKSKKSEFIRLSSPKSRFFFLSPAKGSKTTLKAAPGLSLTYKLTFRPEDLVDYAEDLRIMTDYGDLTLPVHAYFSRGRLQLPPEVVIEKCPVKGSASTLLFLRNADAKPCRWGSRVPEPFALSPCFGTVAPNGGVMPIKVFFNANALAKGAAYSLESLAMPLVEDFITFLLGSEGDREQRLPVRATLVELPVRLEQSEVEFTRTFVTTQRQAVVRLINESDHVIRFFWKGAYSDATLSLSGKETHTMGTDTVEGNDAVFDDPDFAIDPVQGELYGRASREFTVIFRPHIAIHSSATAFLEVTGLRKRLPLHLTGCARGPECRLQYSKLNLGQTYVNSIHVYKVNIENLSCIEARYTILPPKDTIYGPFFTFFPSKGVLQPGDVDEISITFRAATLGIVSECIPIHLHGSQGDDLSLNIRGYVVAPSYALSVEEVNFGCVSYGFTHQRTFTFANTSQIELCYHLKLPPSCPYAEELAILPATGTLQPSEVQTITVTLVANVPGAYETALLIFLDGVDEELWRLPVKALAETPTFHVAPLALDFGDCYVGYDYTREVEVRNETALAAHVKLELDSDTVKGSGATIKINQNLAESEEAKSHYEVVEAHSTTRFSVTVQMHEIDSLSCSLNLHTMGDSNTVHHVVLSAGGIGPVLKTSVSELSFDSLKLLEDAQLSFTVKNVSPIPAQVRLYFARSRSDQYAVFHVSPSEAVIQPKGGLDVKVTACLDEAKLTTDNLIVENVHAPDALKPIPVKALGRGFALVFDGDFSLQNHLGDFFTGTAMEHTFTLINKGRRDQEVQWLNVRGNRVKENSAPIVFKIKPERAVICARRSVTFTVCIFSQSEGTFSDTFALKQCVSFKQISFVRIEANFILPLIVYNTQSLSFTHIQQGSSSNDESSKGLQVIEPEKDDSERPVSTSSALITTDGDYTKSFSMKNVTGKKLNVELRIRERGPFRIAGDLKFVLASGGTRVVGVEFDPYYRQDFLSHEVKNKVLIKFLEHPRMDNVLLQARLVYPSLELSVDRIHFGAIIRNTEVRREVVLTNPSTEVPVRFEWKLQLTDVVRDMTAGPEEHAYRGAAESVSDSAGLHSSPEGSGEPTCFDFLPFKGCIAPGGKQVVEVVFGGVYGLFQARALCQVRGGLSYPLWLSGSAVDVGVQCDHTTLDFGCMPFYAEASRTLQITNPSCVTAPFRVELLGMRSGCAVRVSPKSGVLEGEKLSLTVVFSPCVPDEVSEDILITIGHFDPQRVTVLGRGLVNSIAISGVDSRVEVRRNTTNLYEKAYKTVSRKAAATKGPKGSEASLYSTRMIFPLPSPPSFLDFVALEAERLAFCAALIARQKVYLEGENARQGLPRISEETTECSEEVAPTGELTCGKSAKPNPPFCRTMRRSSTSVNGPNKHILASYTVDFGHMTRNDVRTTKVRLTNTSSESLFLMFDSKELANLPITISPMRVQALSPMASLFLEVTIDVAANYDKLIYSGDNTFEFAIDVKGGPVVLLACHCYVATPQIMLSETQIDFGDVLLGNVNIMPLTLTNIEEVPCNWKLSFPKHSSKGLDSSLLGGSLVPGEGVKGFWCRQEKGVIAPHEKVNVDVCFAPLRTGTAQVRLLIRVSSNTKVNTVICKGFGRELKVVMNPSPYLEFPVTSLFSVSHAQLRITNHENVAVEVFSYNLDNTNAEEQLILNKFLRRQGSSSNDVNQSGTDPSVPYLLLPLRSAGESLPHDVLNAVYEDLEDQLNQEALTPEMGELMAAVHRSPHRSSKPLPNILDQKTMNKASAAHDLERGSTQKLKEALLAEASPLALDSPIKQQKSLHHSFSADAHPEDETLEGTKQTVEDALPQSGVILLLGPPESGKTTQSCYFVKEFDCELIELDPLVHAEAARDTANGEVLQNIITIHNLHGGEGEREITPNGRGNEGGHLTTVPTLDELSNRYFSLIPRILTSLLQARLEKSPSQPAPDIGTNLLPEAANKQHHKRRFVIDDLHCCLTKDPRLLLHVLCNVCEALNLPLFIVSLCVCEATIGLRRASSNRARCEEEVKSSYVDLLSEEAFEKLDTNQRETYNRQLKHLNECRRALSCETAEMERFMALLEEKTQNTIQKICHSEERAYIQGTQAIEASARASHRSARSNNTASLEQQRPEVNWKQLTPLAAFKELYKYLSSPKFSAQLVTENPLNPAQTFFIRLLDVNAEYPKQETSFNILDMINSRASDAPADGPHGANLVDDPEQEGSEDGAPVSSSCRTASPLKAASVSNVDEKRHRLSDFDNDPSVCKVGLWSFLDAARLQVLGSYKPIPFVRFFSEVELEVQVPHSGKKVKIIPTVTTRAYEELTRWLIPAKSYVDIMVEFCCDRAGDYAIPCTFGVVGTQQCWELIVKARAAVPDICRDDKIIFPSIRSRLPANVPPSNVYLQSKMIYHFGSLLVPSPNVKGKRGERTSFHISSSASPATSGASPHTSITTLNLGEVKLTFANNGSFPCDVGFSFLKEKERTFSFTPNKLHLEVSETQTITLNAAPEVVGEITNTLIACVSGNPTPWFVHLSCIGSRPSLNFDGKKEATIDLGRTIIQRHAQREITLANTSSMPISWRFIGHEKLPAELQLSASSGVLDVYESQPLVVSFVPTTTCLHQLTLQVQVSDATLKTIIYETLPVVVKAEGHDVIMEWTREVDFKIMHVGETKKETIRLLNKGPYDVGYVIRYPKRLMNVLSLSSQKGIIRGMLGYKDAAVAKIDVTAYFDHEGEISPKLGQLELAFFEVGVEELLYPVQVIPVRGEAWYMHCVLKPSLIDFGSCFANQRKETRFEIHNTGRFPLQFMLFNYKEGCAHLRQVAAGAEGLGTPAAGGSPGSAGGGAWGGSGSGGGPLGAGGASLAMTGRTGERRLSEMSGAMESRRVGTARSSTSRFPGSGGKAGGELDFVLGSFIVTPAHGSVQAGETQVITVSTVPQGNHRICEKLGIYIPQGEPEVEERGIAVELIASPATPGILADLSSADVETIFEEQHVVNHLSQLERRTRAYCKKDRIFSFGAVLLGRRVEERFRIANCSSLPCTVTVQLACNRTPNAKGTTPHPAVQSSPSGGATGVNLTSSGADYSSVAPDCFDLSSNRGADTQVQSPTQMRMVLPPFESRLVSVAFNPSALEHVNCLFVAMVEGGVNPSTKNLVFDITGEGTLPMMACIMPPRIFTNDIRGEGNLEPTSSTLTNKQLSTHSKNQKNIVKESHRRSILDQSTSSAVVHESQKASISASHVLQLPLTLVGTTSTRAFTVQNVGEIPADVRLTLITEDEGSGALQVDKLNQDVTIPVGAKEVFEVSFEPKKAGKFVMKLCVSLTDNPFENKEILVEARSYTQFISFEGIDPASTDLVELGDCYLDNPKKHVFTMKNNTKEDIRFIWQIPSTAEEAKNGGTAAHVQILPDVGHIFAGSVKSLTLTFTSHETAAARKLLTCRLIAQSIKLKRSLDAWEKSSNNGNLFEGRFDDTLEWDSTTTASKWVSGVEDDGVVGIMSGVLQVPPTQYMEAGRRHLKRVLQPLPEPPYQLTDTLAISQELHLGYHCEVPMYELQIQQEQKKGDSSLLFKSISSMDIHFDSTMLYQRRIVSLRVRNAGTIALPFAFRIENPSDNEELKTSLMPRPIEELRAHDALVDKKRVPVEGAGSFTALLNEVNAPPPQGPEFSIEPAEGVVSAGGHQDISVIFAPCVVGPKERSATMIAEFPFSTSPKQVFTLRGLGVCPLVHFQIPPSDYLMKHSSDKVMNAATTLVLEFLSRNLYTRTPMRFKVINPTKINYTFEWQDLTDPGNTFSPFRCLTPGGQIHAEKQVEMGFEFCADELGVREARWAFNLIGQASIPFLLVGKAVDPEVFLSSSKVNFGAVIIGNSATQTVMLENRDLLPFNFSFDILEESGVLNVLSVKPSSGVIEPKGKVAVNVVFTPNEEMVYNIPLMCNIKKSSTVLSINVKGEGVCIHDSLLVEIPEIGRMINTGITPDTTSEDSILVSRGEPLHLNFGRVQLDSCAVRRFVLSNNGQHPFNFKVLAPSTHPSVTLDNCDGVISPKESAAIMLTYRPTVEETLQRYKIRFRVADRPAYQVVLHGTGYVPKMNLSFTSYNFGPRFITMYNLNHEVTTALSMNNTDREPISVQLAFSEDTERIFQVEPSFLNLQPNETATVTVSFHPREVRVYERKLKLIINGAYPTMVSFRGEGEVPHVEVVNHFAKLGVARVGAKRQVEVRLECRSRLPTPVSFDNCIDEDLIEKGISISTDMIPPNTLATSLVSDPSGVLGKLSAPPQSPSTMILLKPRETKTIRITFQPLRRMGEFQRKLRMQVCGRETLFAIISGSCEGSEIHLDTSHLRFDDVVVGSSATRRLMIMNSGDIAQKFTWNGLHRCETELTVHPMSGFLRSHTEIACVVTYSPQRPDSSFQRAFEITFEDAPPLSVIVNGSSVARPAAKDVVHFSCRARETNMQNVVFENPLSKPWHLEPVISNPVWCAPRRLTVKPFATVALPVTYAPMKPTTAAPDGGVLFLPLPDGAGRSYGLEGHADAAGPVGPPLQVEVEAKTPYPLALKVENWAPTPLRFMREVTWSPELEDGIISLSGATPAASGPLEVRAQSSKEAALTLTCMREGTYKGTIAFHCPENPDMRQYYEVQLKVLPPSAESVVTTELYAAAQTCAVHNITLANPLSKQVVFTSRMEVVSGRGSASHASTMPNTSIADFLTVPSSIQVPAKSAVNFPVQFIPLLHKSYPSVKVILSSEDLGVTHYLYKLTAAPQSPEPITRLVCPLGQSITFTLRFAYLGKATTEFTVTIPGNKINGSSTTVALAAIFTKATPGGNTFKVTPSAAAQWPKGQDVAVEFVYEPQAIGSVTETILFTSPVGGTFTFPVVGTCTAPYRQGPVVLKPDSTTSISFKNVFSHSITISISTDPSQNFIASKKSDVIAPKKSTNLVLQCKMDDNMDTCYGKLIVSCTPPGTAEPIEWIYYLEGRRADGTSASRRSVVVRRK